MNEKLGKVTGGFTSCPASMISEAEHGERLTLPGTDERVHCIACRRIVSEYDHGLRAKIMELPKAIQRVVLELISFDLNSDDEPVAPYRIFRIDRPAAITDPASEHDRNRILGAAACGNEDVLAAESERVVIQFSLSTKNRIGDTVHVSYLPDAVEKMASDPVACDCTSFSQVVNGGTSDGGNEFQNFGEVLTSRYVSPERARAIRGLLQLGFKPVVVDTGTMPRILLRNTISDSRSEDGVKVEFKWLASWG